MNRRWDDLRRDFETVVFRDGVTEVARRLSTHRTTVYRLVNGDTRRPSGPLRAAVEKVVADATSPEDKVKAR